MCPTNSDRNIAFYCHYSDATSLETVLLWLSNFAPVVQHDQDVRNAL